MNLRFFQAADRLPRNIKLMQYRDMMSFPKLISQTILLSLALMIISLCSVPPAWSKEASPATDTIPHDQIYKSRSGDLDELIKRRIIRVLVTYNKTNFFLDGPASKGVTYELLTQFEKHLNKKLKTRHLNVHLVFIPVTRDQLLPRLKKGLGDIAAASLTITPQRQKEVDFTAPLYDKAEELVVASPSAPKLTSLSDLSGKTVHVRKSSSYYQSLLKLNKELKAAGKAPVKIELVSELLETEDILEMLNADIYQITVADDYLAEFWQKIFKNLQVHQKLALRTHGKIAWAIRKNSPQLKKELDAFVKKVKVGTKLGNIITKRYYENTKFARSVLANEDLARFEQTIKFFKKYAGKYSFDWLMVAALGYQESGLDQSKRSPAGAVGVMQILPSTAAKPPISIPDIYKMDKNIHAGVKYLRFLYDQYYKNQPMSQLDKMLFTFASYNAGPARVAGLRGRAPKMGLDPNKWFRNVEVAAAKAIGRETVQYVSNIFKYYLAYSRIMSKQLKKEKVIEQIKKQ
jgi:membrane-bound lytic murein transglycosylase MltF